MKIETLFQATKKIVRQPDPKTRPARRTPISVRSTGYHRTREFDSYKLQKSMEALQWLSFFVKFYEISCGI
ncbi:hypothetical protein, partial [Eubacterium pyruvativorans]|uniref:hypothetical protein n=1 Tax=Eubacterium pyruvativorans TaxID=155865 RepID=UPI001A9A2D5D